MLIALLLPVFLQPGAATPRPMWSGDFTITMTGDGRAEKPLGTTRMAVTWHVDRVARGRIVLDRMFKGGGIAGTPSTRDTMRYETWIANLAQPLELVVRDTGTYFGPTPNPRHIALDVSRHTCPAPDGAAPRAQVRSGILQFDKVQGTWTLETPRMIARCETGTLRTPKAGPPEWMARSPFRIESNSLQLEFEVWHRLAPLPEWDRMTGPYREGQDEIVLTRSFTFQWMHPLTERPAPVHAELVLVLRRIS
jgi:hypothetical protein